MILGLNISGFVVRPHQEAISSEDFGANTATPIPLTDAERASHLIVVPIPPMDIELRFATSDQWGKVIAKLGPKVAGVTWRLPSPGKPCLVIFPASDFYIMAYAAHGDAQWFSSSLGRETVAATKLAHEFLHCTRGTWHPPFSEISNPNSAYEPLSLDSSLVVGK